MAKRLTKRAPVCAMIAAPDDGAPMRLVALIPTAATLLVVGYSLNGCGGTEGDSPARAPASSTPVTQESGNASPPTTTADGPTAQDTAAAKAICAEPFYSQAYGSVSACEAKMSDPKAVDELRRGIESMRRETDAAKARIKELDRDGDGQVDPGALPGVP